MIRRRLNIASVQKMTPLSVLIELSRSTERVRIFSTRLGREVGFCEPPYVLEGDDLYSETCLDDDAFTGDPGLHAEGIIARNGTRAVLCAVVLTHLPLGMLHQAALGKPFVDAVRSVMEANFRRVGKT